MRLVGAVLFWLGLVILVAGALIGWFGGTRAVDAVRTTVDEAGPMPGGTASVQLQEGERRTIYEQTQGDFPSASCQVTGPDGGALELFRSAEAGGPMDEMSYTTVGEFEAATTGAHAVTCTGATTLLGPSLDFGSMGYGALGVLGGILGAGLGLLMMLVGAILCFVGRSKDRNSQSQHMPGDYGYGPYRGRPPPPPPSG